MTWTWDAPRVRLPEGDARPQPVTIYDATGRALGVFSANDWKRLHGRTDEIPVSSRRRHTQAPLTIARRCPKCGTRLGRGGVCLGKCRQRRPDGSLKAIG